MRHILPKRFCEIILKSNLLCRCLANRAMAIGISLMAGRIGCVVGANIVAYLLENQCEAVFYLSGSSLIGKKDCRNI